MVDIDVDQPAEVADRDHECPECKDAGVHDADGGVLFDSGKPSHEADHGNGGDAGQHRSDQHRRQGSFAVEYDFDQQVASDHAGQH